MDPFNDFSDFTPVSEEEFDAVVKRILNDGEEVEQSEPEWTIEGQKIFNVMTPAILSYVNFAIDYNSYVTGEANTKMDSLSETSNVYNKCVVHPHDIMLDNYTIIEPISFIQFSNMLKEIEEPDVAVLALSYKKGSFNVSVIEYTNNREKYKEAYKTGNIALYFLPRTIKRLSGNAAAKGKDIIAQFNDRLIKYGYRIERGKIVGVVHTVTDYDAESIAKVLRKINNAMHE